MTAHNHTSSFERNDAEGELVLKALQVSAARAQERASNLRHKRNSRTKNLQPERLSDDDLKQLDASIKKNGALVKKLKVLSAANIDVVLVEVVKINQSKFLTEAALSLADANVKPARAPGVLKVAELLHQRYAEFAPAFTDALLRYMQPKHLTDNSKEAVLRRQACFRVLVDLDLLGIHPTIAALEAPLRLLASSKFAAGNEVAVAAIQQLIAFTRAAREDVLNMPADLCVDLPPGSPTPHDLANSVDVATSEAAAALLSAVEQLGSEMQQRCVSGILYDSQ